MCYTDGTLSTEKFFLLQFVISCPLIITKKWVWVLDYYFISSHFKTTHSLLVYYTQWLLCTFSGRSMLNYCSASMIDQPLQKSEGVGHRKHPFFLQLFNGTK